MPRGCSLKVVLDAQGPWSAPFIYRGEIGPMDEVDSNLTSIPL